MAFQTWEENYLRAIMNSFTAAGYESEEQITAMLARLKLEQDLRALESELRNLQAAEVVEQAAYEASLAANATARAAKQAEIDAL